MTGPLSAVTVFPLASCIATWTAGEIAVPVNPFEGCARNANFTGVVTVKLALVDEVSPELLATSV
jgi:hypothetical protein